MIIISSFLFYGMLVFTFTLFRVPLRKSHVFTKGNYSEDRIYDVKITILVLSVAITNFYTRSVLHSPLFLMLNVVVFISILVLIKSYPLLYAFIIVTTGYIITGTVDMIVTLSGVALNLTNEIELHSNLLHYTIANSIVTIIMLILAWVIKKLKINLSLIIRRFVGKQVFKRNNFIWMVILLVGLVYMEISWFGLNTPSLYIWIFIGMVALLIASLIHAFIRNKEHVKARHEGTLGSSSPLVEQFLKQVEEAKRSNDNK